MVAREDVQGERQGASHGHSHTLHASGFGSSGSLYLFCTGILLYRVTLILWGALGCNCSQLFFLSTLINDVVTRGRKKAQQLLKLKHAVKIQQHRMAVSSRTSTSSISAIPYAGYRLLDTHIQSTRARLLCFKAPFPFTILLSRLNDSANFNIVKACCR